MKKLKVTGISHGKNRLKITLKKERVFLKHFPDILEDLGLDAEPCYLPKVLTEIDQKIFNFSDEKYNLEFVFFKRTIVMIFYGNPKNLDKAKKIMFKHADFEGVFK